MFQSIEEDKEITTPKESLLHTQHMSTSFALLKRLGVGMSGLLVLFFVFVYITLPPAQFPTHTFFKVSEGSTLFKIVHNAEDMHIVRSSLVLRSLIIFLGGERTVQAGDYYFDRPMNVLTVAQMFAWSNFNIALQKLTIPEGYTNKQIAGASHIFPHFDATHFLELTKMEEGYLFPDTYFFSPESTADDVRTRLKENYEVKITPLRPDISQSGHTEKEIIIMASLIEKEAFGESDRAVVSGILWNRIDRGMALQVDAPFLYLLGKESSELTLTDLKIDSPYNTYIHTGLPPTPIGNPGLSSIKAALYPAQTDYLFYLHDAQGRIHYAKTFAEHKKNKALYLK